MQIKASIKFGAYTLKKQDFFCGEIEVNGKKVCEIVGNYSGYIDIDGVRYWDIRDDEEF